MARPQPLRFWVYLVPLVPSIICSIFLLYHLLSRRALRNAVNNHVIILMIFFGLLYELTDFIWYIHFYHTGTLVSATATFCRLWAFIDGAVYVIVAILMAWASIERHILIFHPNWIATKIKCFFFHYLPLIVCCLHPVLFYSITLFVIPCDVPLDFTVATCNAYNCVTWNPSVGLWDNVLNFILPVLVIVLFSVALLARVLYQRSRAQGRIEWRNYRKMAVQLLSISAIYFIFLLPTMLVSTAYLLGMPWNGGSDYYWATQYLGYYTVLLTPFVCVISLPELQSKWKRLRCCRRRGTIVPDPLTVHQAKGTRIATVTTSPQ